jgi:2-haloacid dehalogenase
MPRLTLALFDVNETLSDLEPLRARFEAVGAPGELLELWFASTLRDGFALTAAGAYADFRKIAVAVLRGYLAQVGSLTRDPGEAAEDVVAGFAELAVHPDVEEGVHKLADAGVRMATLTNGAAELATRLLERAGLAELVERRLSVDDVQRWKPACESYLYAVREVGVSPQQSVLIAVHPWDIDGAKRAGLQAAWLNRTGGPFPSFFQPPDFTSATLGELADAVLAS